MIGYLLGFEVGAKSLPSDLEAQAVHEMGTAAFVDWAAGLASADPVVVVLDDIHWADDPSLDLAGPVGQPSRGAGGCFSSVAPVQRSTSAVRSGRWVSPDTSGSTCALSGLWRAVGWSPTSWPRSPISPAISATRW